MNFTNPLYNVVVRQEKEVAIILTAHSGSDQTAENSLSFVKTMLKHDIKAIEVDIRLNPETNQLYLAHDVPTDCTKVVLLEEVFQILQSHSNVQINCDLKEEQLETKVMELAKKYLAKNQVIFSGTVDLENIPPSWLENIFFNIENILPKIYDAVNQSEATQVENIRHIIDFAKTHQIEILNMNYHLATDGVIDLFHQENIKLSLWTVNDFELIDHFKKKGLYNVTTRKAIGYRKYRNKGRGD